MKIALASNAEQANWAIGIGAALAAHAVVGTVVLTLRAEAESRPPEPIMMVELPAGAMQAAKQAEEQLQPQPEELPSFVEPTLDLPEVSQPLPPDPVVAPTPRPIPRIATAQPVRQPDPVQVPQRTSSSSVSGTTDKAETDGPGNDPRAKEREADWYALVSAHLNRKKRYPREAKKAGQRGTPTVRFTVDRRGRVFDISITRSSGFEQLDQATISLISRAAPLPTMPSSMGREKVTISLPIDYSLSRK